jgi:hypothetical protein
MEFFQANAPENNDHVYLHISDNVIQTLALPLEI